MNDAGKPVSDFLRRLLIASPRDQPGQNHGRQEDDHGDVSVNGLVFHTGRLALQVPFNFLNANPFRTIGFFVLQIYLFFLMSRVVEYVDPQQHYHLAFLAATLAAVAACLGFTVGNAFDTKIGLALAAFSAWAIFELPFSSWRGGSFHTLMNTWLKSYVTYIIVVSLIVSFTQLRKALTCVAFATACIVFLSFKLGMTAEADNRLSFESGMLANSNDLAMQLILGLPFILYLALDSRRKLFVRIFFGGVVPVLLYVVLRTGSRAGLVALVGMAVMLFFRSTGSRRWKMVIVAAVLAVCAPLVLNHDLRERYRTILTGTSGAHLSDVASSAAESEMTRRQLIVHAIVLSAKHPVFGVGMDQFAPASATLSTNSGQAAMWHPVHSFLLLVLAETGIPGALFYTAAVVYCLIAVFRISRFTRDRKDLAVASEVSEALLYSYVGFCICMLFSPGAYLYHLPLMAAFVTALERFTRSQQQSEIVRPAPQLVAGFYLGLPTRDRKGAY